MAISDSINTKFFKFKLENEDKIYVIPQTINDGSDTIQFSANWSKLNLPGSTEPMVAFNYTDAPVTNVNLKFHEDMWQEANLDKSGYLDVINKFASLSYPGSKNQTIVPPYVMIYIDNYVYRGYFTNIRINQYGLIRNGYKIMCEISSAFTIIKRYAPIQLDVASKFRVYFIDS